MFILSALLPKIVFEQPNDTGTPPQTPSQTPDPAPTGNDTPPADNDTLPASEGDLLGDDTPPGDPAPEGDLLGDPAPAEFNMDEVTADLIKEAFPDTTEWDESALEGLLKLVNTSGSRTDIVKGAIEMFDEAQQTTVTEMNNTFNATVNEWKEATRALPDLGGDNLPATLATVKTFINTYAVDAKETTTALQQTGLSNHPQIISLLHAAAKAVPGEAAPVDGSPAKAGQSMADRMFGSSNTQE